MRAKTILLMEDNPSDVDLTKRALQKGDFDGELAVAEDGEDALDYFFGGGDHAGRVLILTSSHKERDIANGYDLGVNSYIHKPVDFKQFAEAIQQLGSYWLVLNEAPQENK